jgi:hypothetical protein
MIWETEKRKTKNKKQKIRERQNKIDKRQNNLLMHRIKQKKKIMYG